MRSIVALFALSLAACAPFERETASATDAEQEPVKQKSPSNTAAVEGPSATPSTPEPVAPTPAPGAAFPGSQVFKPAQTPAPGVVVVHGSEGGGDAAYRSFAESLASAGFVVMALCWSGCPSPPPRPALELLAAAGTFLKESADTTHEVGVFGWDTGAEAALVLAANASTDPFAAVAIFNSTDVTRSAWSFNGRAIAIGETIDVARYAGPMFVLHGEDDPSWPVDRGMLVVHRRESAPTSLDTDALVFPDEGHTLTKSEDRDTLRDDVAGWFHLRLR